MAADAQCGVLVTTAQAEAWLRHDLSTAEHAVNIGSTIPLTQNQFDALVSFAYNVGVGTFLRSSLRRLLNEGKTDEALHQFGLYVHAGGQIEPGLVRRRAAEAAMFRGDAHA